MQNSGLFDILHYVNQSDFPSVSYFRSNSTQTVNSIYLAEVRYCHDIKCNQMTLSNPVQTKYSEGEVYKPLIASHGMGKAQQGRNEFIHFWLVGLLPSSILRSVIEAPIGGHSKQS